MADPGLVNATDAAPPLRRDTVRGAVFWGAALPFFTKALSILVTLALVRLLAPEMFGQYGLANAILLFAFTFSMARFMRKSFFEEDASDRYPSHFAFGVGLHVALFALLNLTFLVAPLPETHQAVAPYVHVGSLALLLNVPRLFYSLHLQRMLAWRELRTLHLIAALLSAVVALSLALSGGGVYALLAQNLIVPLPYAAALVLRRPDLIRLRFDLAGYRETLRFGAFRTGAALAQTTRPLCEASLFTGLRGFAEYGVYGRAIGLGRLTAAWLADQVAGVALPMLARLTPGTDPARRAAGLVLRLALWTSAPIAIAIALFPGTAVGLLYGPGWSAVAPLVAPALALAVLTATLGGLSLVLLTTAGAAAALGVDLALLAAGLAGLWLALPEGPLAYAWFLVAADGLVLAALVFALLRRQALAWGDTLRALAPPAALAALGLLAAQSDRLAAWNEAQTPLALAGALAAAALLALAAARLLDPAGLAEACRFAPGGARLARLLRLTPPRDAPEA